MKTIYTICLVMGLVFISAFIISLFGGGIAPIINNNESLNNSTQEIFNPISSEIPAEIHTENSEENSTENLQDKSLWEPCDKRHNASYRYKMGCTGNGDSTQRSNPVQTVVPEIKTFLACIIGLFGIWLIVRRT